MVWISQLVKKRTITETYGTLLQIDWGAV